MLAFIMILGVGIVIAYNAAVQFEEIAIMKGYNDKKYFWWCFLALGIGIFMVIALPDRSKFEENIPILQDKKVQRQIDELPEI